MNGGDGQRALGDTFPVLNTNDAGAGSLRQAILDANANPGFDTITFNPAAFPPGAPAVISPLTELPAMDDPDGTSVNGTRAGVIIDGAGLAGNEMGLRFHSGAGNPANNATARNLTVRNFPHRGIYMCGGDGVLSCINHDNNNSLIDGVTLIGNGHTGAYITGKTVTNAVITNTVTMNNGFHGFEINSCTGDMIEPVVTDNTSMANERHGMQVNSCDVVVDATITGNKSLENEQFGMQVNSSDQLINPTVSDNVASDNDGKGIYVNASDGIFGADIAGNRVELNGEEGIYVNASDGIFGAGHTAGNGGAIWSEGSTTIVRSTISGNQTGSGNGVAGGLIATSRGAVEADGGTVNLTNSTVSGNTGASLAAIDGTIALGNVTLVAGDTGIINNGTVSAQNSIISGGEPNCVGTPVNSLGNNLEDANGCGLSGPGDQVNTDPVLGPLADNGGPTQTHALLQGSPAIDTGSTPGCQPNDQRLQIRPKGLGCDIGAFESSFAMNSPTPTPSPTPVPTAGPPQGVIWGDNNCSGSADPVDALLTLRFDAGLSSNTGDCPAIGTSVDVQEGSVHFWGDVDCSGQLPDPIDSLKGLRFDAGLGYSQTPDCPLIGAQVTIQ